MAAGAQTPKNVKYEFTEASDLAGRDEIKHASRAFSLLLAGGALAIYGSPQKPMAFVLALCLPRLTEASFRRSGIHKAHVSDAHVGFLVAERTRFELVIRVFAYDGLANRWFQPLTHLSGTLFRREIVPIRLD